MDLKHAKQKNNCQLLLGDVGKQKFPCFGIADFFLVFFFFFCSAFGGDTSEKFVQQLCAAELAGVQLDYSCYKRDGLKDDLSDIWKLIQNKKATIGQLIEICCDFENVGGVFHDYLLKQLKKL